MHLKGLKAYFNILKFRVNQRLRRKRVGNYPLEAYVEPTSFCNLGCPACPTGLRLGERPSKSIDPDLFKKALDDLGDHIFRLWMYNWGEPLLHRQTPELIAYAKTKKLHIIMSSNLSIPLGDEYIERLVASGLDSLIVSLDGVSPDMYGKYRINGDLDLVKKNLGRIRDAKQRAGSSKPKVIWQFLVFKHNEHEIERALAQYQDWGADEINVAPAEMPMPPYNAGFEPSSIPRYSLYAASNNLNREAQARTNGQRACSWLYGSFVLNPNGKVSACCGVSSEANDFAVLGIGDDFFDVYNSPRYRRARATKPRGPDAEPSADVVHRVDGMAVATNRSLAEGELICDRCPIPFRQDEAAMIVREVAYDLAGRIRKGSSIRERIHATAAYAAAGFPSFLSLARDAIRGRNG